jgi:hypothetical protein
MEHDSFIRPAMRLALVMSVAALLVSLRTWGISQRALIASHRPYIDIEQTSVRVPVPCAGVFEEDTQSESDLCVVVEYKLENMGLTPARDILWHANFTWVEDERRHLTSVKSTSVTSNPTPASSLAPGREVYPKQTKRLMMKSIEDANSLVNAIKSGEVRIKAEATASYRGDLQPRKRYKTAYTYETVYNRTPAIVESRFD